MLCAGLREKRADDCDGIGAGLPTGCGVLKSDAADGDKRLCGERADGFEGVDADGGIRPVFGGGRKDRTECHVVDGFRLRRGHLGGIVGGESDDGVRTQDATQDASGVGGREVVLPEVEAGVEECGVIGAVVNDEGGLGFAAEIGDSRSLIESARLQKALCRN